jgi:pyrroloquinoline quinone (PQQ) biosynthesis protein C
MASQGARRDISAPIDSGAESGIASSNRPLPQDTKNSMTSTNASLQFRGPPDTSQFSSMDSQQQTLPRLMKELLALPAEAIDAWAYQDRGIDQLVELAKTVSAGACRGTPSAVAELHMVLGGLYELTFVIPKDSVTSAHGSCALRLVQALLERGAIQHLQSVTPKIDLQRRYSGEAFVEEIKEISRRHAAFDHPYYNRTLREEGSVTDLRFYFSQEVTVDPRFDDLVAMLQIGTQGATKLELADNYCDEMGNGNPADVHSDLFAKAITALRLDEEPIEADLSVEARICGNVSALLASRRENFYRGAGYFGIMEFLVPRRMEHVLYSWQRNGLPMDAVRYHVMHMSIDETHANGWFRNVIKPAVDSNPECATEILEGVIWRLETSRWYLDMLQAKARRTGTHD